MSKSLITGSPWRSMLFFAIPLLIGNIVQQLYQVADAMVVGQQLGVGSLAAVGATGGVMFLLLGFVWGLTTGFAIPTAQRFGAGDEPGVRASVAAGTLLTAAVSVIMTMAGPLAVEPLMRLLRTPPELLGEATTFGVVSLLSASAIMFFNFLSAIIRAIGDSRTPLVFLVLACLLNVALVLVFIGLLHMGVAGAALATGLAQLFSAAACYIYVLRHVPSLHVRKPDWVRGFGQLGSHLAIGLPMGFQASIIAIGSLAVQVRLNSLGAETIAAYTTGARVDGLAVAFLNSIGIAVTTFVAQNAGARHYDRVRQGVRQALVLATGTAVVLAALLITSGDLLVRSFVGTGEEKVVSMAHEFLVVNGLAYWVLGILFVTRGALQGLGHTFIPTVSGIFELLMRVSAAVILGGSLGFAGVIWANPLAWAGASLFLVPAWLIVRRGLAAKSASQITPAKELESVAA